MPLLRWNCAVVSRGVVIRRIYCSVWLREDAEPSVWLREDAEPDKADEPCE